MNTVLIVHNTALLELLTPCVQAAGLHLGSALGRKKDLPLTAQLEPLMADLNPGVLVLESAPAQAQTDLQALDALTLRCPQLNVVLLSEDSSKEHLQRAMRAGVREVLPLPAEPAELTRILARFAQQHHAAQPGSAAMQPSGAMVAFIACKGGAGASFLSTQMAQVIASEFQRECRFIDMDLQRGDASFYLGSAKNKHTIAELTGQIGRLDAQLLDSCMSAIAPGLQLLAAPGDMESALAINAPQTAQILSLAQSRQGVLVVDLPCCVDAITLKVLDMANTVYLVAGSDMPLVRDAQRLARLLGSLAYPQDKVKLIVNRHATEHGMALKDIEKVVGLKVSHTVPEHASAVRESIHLGQPLHQLHPRSPVTQALRQIAADLLGQPLRPPTGWLTRWFAPQAHRPGRPAPSRSTTPGAALESRPTGTV